MRKENFTRLVAIGVLALAGCQAFGLETPDPRPTPSQKTEVSPTPTPTEAVTPTPTPISSLLPHSVGTPTVERIPTPGK